jgi:ABC-type multidrug transport system ATPase subunit
MPALSIRSLRKSFLFGPRHAPRRREALRGVDLDVEQGEVVGLVGDKSSGKTTLLMCAAGLLRGDSGSIHWYGKRLTGGGCLRDLVYVAPMPSYYPFLTVRDILTRNARSASGYFATARAIEGLADRLSLTGRLGARVNELSIPELKLLAIAQALTEEPRIILIDATLDALDNALPVVRRALAGETAIGSTMIVSARQASMLAGFVTRMVVMEAGQITASFAAQHADESAAGTIAFAGIDAKVRQIAERVH